MLAFVIKRLSYGFLVILGVVTVVFLLFNVLPGDPARMMLDQREDAEQLKNIRAKYGFDKPLSTQYALYLNDLSPISLHSQELNDYSTLKREVKYGTNSKIDILLQDDSKKDCYVEIKNVHLSREKGLAEFPDAITTRGAKHLRELSLISKSGLRAVMLYLIQRNDCNFFKIAQDIDTEYAEEFNNAIKAGVEVICMDTILSNKAIDIGKNIQLLINK